MRKIEITLSISTGKFKMEIQRVKNKKTTLPESQPFRGGAVWRKGTGRQGNGLDAVVLWKGGDGAGPEKAEKSWCPCAHHDWNNAGQTNTYSTSISHWLNLTGNKGKCTLQSVTPVSQNRFPRLDLECETITSALHSGWGVRKEATVLCKGHVLARPFTWIYIYRAMAMS